MNKINI